MNALVWTDIESTGLDHGKDHLLEIAVVITDERGEVLDSLSDLALPMNPVAFAEMVDVMREAPPGTGPKIVYDMHHASGLWDEVLVRGVSYKAVDERISNWLANECATRYNLKLGKMPMCGNTVSWDKEFLKTRLPNYSDKFGHRVIDISSIKELAKALPGDVDLEWADYCDEHGTKPHRAMDDILFSIKEYQFYLEKGFIGL